jgi:hypothetical protein
MDCAMCAHLTSECGRLKSSYGIAVEHLFAFGYAVTDEEYRQLKSSTENARSELESAQYMLAAHQKLAHRHKADRISRLKLVS